MQIIKLDATDSTNDHLRQMLLANEVETPTVVSSLFQKKGKGQRGQVWTSQAGKNLMFSLYIPNLTRSADQLFSINKIVSVCLAGMASGLSIGRRRQGRRRGGVRLVPPAVAALVLRG